MWHRPIANLVVPTSQHHGAFGVTRKHDIHTGVDLYTNPDANVFAVESGLVVAIEDFTGPSAGSPWWNPTKAILIEGPSGVVLYGEVEAFVNVGDKVLTGQTIARVKTVLKKDKGLPMTMLHMELYVSGTKSSVWWYKDAPRPNSLLDPTQHLLNAHGD